MKYRKLPVVIEAVEFLGFNNPNFLPENLVELFGIKTDASYPPTSNKNGKLCIHTLEGDMTADIGDYIIKGVNGEFYPCKPDIFNKTYEKVED